MCGVTGVQVEVDGVVGGVVDDGVGWWSGVLVEGVLVDVIVRRELLQYSNHRQKKKRKIKKNLIYIPKNRK